MKLHFEWKMSEEQWLALKRAYKLQEVKLGDYFGCVYVGNMAIDIQYHPYAYDDKQYINLEVFALTDDDRGCGYTNISNTPYDFFESFILSPKLDISFDEFKRDVECELTKMLSVRKELLCYAENPLSNWIKED